MQGSGRGDFHPLADRRTVVGTWLLLAAGGMLAAAASFGAVVTIDRTGNPSLHLAAAGFATLTGAGLAWSGWERAGREGRRRPYILLFTAGGSIWLFGQAIGYLVTAPGGDLFNSRIETIPLLLGLPATVAGTFGLARPPVMDRADLIDAVVDAILGSLGLLIIWAVAIIPQWAPALPGEEIVSSVDQMLLLVTCIALVVLVSLSRRPGSLALPQLLLLFGGCFLIVLADLVGEFGLDRRSEVTVSLVGYWAGVALAVAMLHRSSAEVEPRGAAQLRMAIAVGLPFGIVLIAGMLLLEMARVAFPDSGILEIMPVIWAVAVLAVGISRGTAQSTTRTRRQADSAAQLSQSAEQGWISALLRDSSEYVFVLDGTGSIIYSSPRSQEVLANASRFEELLAEEADQLPGLLSAVLAGAVPPGPHDELMYAADGGTREVEVHFRTVRDVSFEGFVITGTDVTDTRRLLERLDLTKRRDDLTGLLTRDAFMAEVAGADRKGARLGVAVLDLNDLGVWNETLGRTGGDAILQAVARQFDAFPDEVAAVGRVSGDGFGCLVVGTTPGQVIESALDRLTAALRGLLLPDTTEVDISFRAGYCVSAAGESLSAQELLDRADVALRMARSSRHSSVVRFRRGMNDHLVRRLSSEQRIREALSGDGIEVHYQPIVTLRDNAVHSLEALARLRTPDGELVMPGDFIPAAEYTGLVRDIDRRVRQIVARDWVDLAQVSSDDLRINVNVHEMEITTGLVHELLAEDLVRKVVVEVTEAALLSRPEEAVPALDDLRDAGGLVAIDDFGTGYSSLSQILSLPCDILKIDRSFISNMTSEPRTMSLVRAIVALAHDLGLQTVAEGVETSEELNALRGLGCDRVQGFWHSPALPLDQIRTWLTARQGNR